MLVGLALRLHPALGSDVGFDETWLIFASRLPLGQRFFGELGISTHPPLFVLLLKVVLDLHHSLLMEKLISLLASVVTLIYLSKILHKMGYPSWVAWVATLCMAFAFNHISISIQVKPDSLALACLVGFLYYFLDYLFLSPPAATRDRVLLQVFLAGAIFTHYYCLVALAVIVAVPFLHVLWNGDYRRGLLECIRQRRVVVDGLVSSTIVAGVVFYFIGISKPFSGGNVLLSFVSPFLLVDGQSVSQFLAANSLEELKIFTPLKGWYQGQLILLAVLQAGVLCWIFVRYSKGKKDQVDLLRQLLPHYLLMGLLLGLIILALRALYPFGGEMRHQSVLLPFVYLWASTVLYQLLQLVRNEKLREKLGHGLVALILVLCLWNHWEVSRAPAPLEDRFPAEIEMASEEIHGSYVWLSDFSFIALYTKYRNWRTDRVLSIDSKDRMDVYRVRRGGEVNYLIRDPTWHHPPVLSKEFLNRVGWILRKLKVERLSVFQITMRNWQRIADPEEYRQRLSKAAPRFGVQLTEFRHEGRGVWATFALSRR